MSKASLISSMVTASRNKGKGGRHIVCISGGLASAYTAWWVKNNIKGKIIYYFNDVMWEDSDLYRFIKDIEKALDIKITEDSDGRNPEQVFYDQKMLGSNRAPICSKILKAERLQEFVLKGDTVYFGIDITEIRRMGRIAFIYEELGCIAKFPLIDNQVFKSQFNTLMKELGVEIPQMYKDGFQHNNCSGGCVRAGERQWLSLLRKRPEVYADRERVEIEFSEWMYNRKKEKNPEAEYQRYHFMKKYSLTELRVADEKGTDFNFEPEEWAGECVGICGRMY